METARRVRQRIRSVLSWCQSHGFVDINEAGEVLNGALPSMAAKREHLRMLPYAEMPRVFLLLANGHGSAEAKLCLLCSPSSPVCEVVRPGLPDGRRLTSRPAFGAFPGTGPRRARRTISRFRCLRWRCFSGPAEVDALKTAARPYAGAEKAGVHDIVLSNWNVVDIEIAFATGSDDETESSAPRVDFAALQMRSRHIEIVFFEAEDFTNPELRRRGDANPEVVDQIETYSRLLSDRHDEIVDSYRRVCGNLLRLRGIDERHAERHEMLEGIADGSTPLKVNVEPRLVVFGFDADQRDGENWRPHRNKLKDRLGNRVIFRGSSKGLTRGISALVFG